MSKYQKLDSEQPTYVEHDDNDDDDADGDDDDNDVYDESFSLYFDDKYKNKANSNSRSNNNNESNINDYNDSSKSSINKLNLNVGNNHSHGHNGNHNNNISTNIMLDFEEHTMEIPLLRSNSNINLHDYEPTTEYNSADDCRCAQPGFGANVKCKSAQEAKCKMLLAISLCCIFMIIEFLGGYIAGSLAIMSDAAHLATDCISFIIGLVAIWLGSRPPDGRMSFGYKRLEVLGALASILGIWILTAMLVLIATQRIFTNDFDLDADTMMTISGIGILINIAMIFILHGSWFMQSGAIGHGHSHAHGHEHAHMNVMSAISDTETTTITTTATATIPNINSDGQNGLKPLQIQTSNEHQHSHSHNHNHSHSHKTTSERNLNLRAAMIHVIGDLVQSIGVFLAAILIKFCPSAKYADPLCTLLFSVIVVMTTVQLFRESLSILLDAVPHGISLHELEMDLTSIEGVKSVHHLNVWNHMSSHSVMMAHLVVDLLTDSNTVLDKATRLATSSKYNIKLVTIQIERLAL